MNCAWPLGLMRCSSELDNYESNAGNTDLGQVGLSQPNGRTPSTSALLDAFTCQQSRYRSLQDGVDVIGNGV